MTLFATGFRPFFLLAAVAGVSLPLLWVASLTGLVGGPAGLTPMAWHVHEMVFGFTGAVVAGFLLTAVQNWTRRTTATGVHLAALAGLWIAARLHAFIGLGPLGTTLDILFYPALALAIGRPLWATNNRRNALFPVLLLVMGGADTALHAQLDPRWLGMVALDAVLAMITIVGGRIIPLFTRNALGVEPSVHPWLDRAALGSVLVLLALDLVDAHARALWALPTGAIHLIRFMGWRGEATLRSPILWVLHLGYLWTILGVGAYGLVAGAALPHSAATHLLTVGGIGTLTLGMMSRVALGHTGRPLLVPRPMGWAFGAVGLAALLRFGWSLQPRSELLWASAAVFAAAFAMYLFRYLPVLTRPRIDGRPG